MVKTRKEWKRSPSQTWSCCPENKDYNGIKLEIGTKVAYNRSGGVVLGKIVGFSDHVSHHSGWLIQQTGDRGKPSNVKHAESIVALPYMFLRDPGEMP